MPRGLQCSVIVTYRCNARCFMCDCFKHPTRSEEELGLDVLRRLPAGMSFCNITGGEPFLRADLPDLVGELYKKAKRIVISTNGSFPEKIIALCEQYPRLGIRISVEGLSQANDAIRGIPHGFDRAMRCLLHLQAAGHPDVGFGMTVQDANAADLLPLYRLARHMGMEFATATLHNSFYFRKTDNEVRDKARVAAALAALTDEMLHDPSPKTWFRAYFNHGLINYLYGNPRLLPCGMGGDAFFLDPWGDVLACNGTPEKLSMGNLHEQSFDEIWRSDRAARARESVRRCERSCWMIGSASPAMRKHFSVPLAWVLAHKLIRRGYALAENSFLPCEAGP